MLLWSCAKDDKTIGFKVQPEQNKLNIKTINIENIRTYTSKGKPLYTNRENQYALLGSINDTYFGKTTAAIDAQYFLSTLNPKFGTNPKLISSTLFIAIPHFLGNINTSLRYKIYQSNFTMDKDALYPSNQDMTSYLGELIADTSITADDNKEVLQILLDKTMTSGNKWGQDILTADASSLSSNDKFTKVFKGLYLTVDTNFSDKGLIWKCDFNSEHSYIQIQYSFTNEEGDLDTNIFKLQFNKETGRFNTYTNNLAPIKDILGKVENDNIYISGLATSQGNISLSSLLSWRDSAKIVIYKAELIAKASKVEGFSMPAKLLLAVNTSDTIVRYVDDYRQGENTNYDGSFHDNDTAYYWVITRHIQRFINQEQNDSLLIIYPEDKRKTNLERVILQNRLNKKEIRLRITYSKI